MVLNEHIPSSTHLADRQNSSAEDQSRLVTRGGQVAGDVTILDEPSSGAQLPNSTHLALCRGH